MDALTVVLSGVFDNSKSQKNRANLKQLRESIVPYPDEDESSDG